MMRTVNQRPSRAATGFSVETSVCSTTRTSSASVGYLRSETRSVMGRPTSPGMSLVIFVAWAVNRRTRSSLSKKRTAISVLSSRFFMSLRVRERPPHFPPPRAAAWGVGRLARRVGGHGRGHVGENDHHQPVQRPGFLQSLDGGIPRVLAAPAPGREPGGRARTKGRGKGARPRAGFGPPEEPRFAAEGGKQVGGTANRLRAAQKQNAARAEAVAEQRNQFFLHLRGQIDQQVATAQDVQLGKGRIHDEILRRKNHQLANLFEYPVAAFFFDKEPAQPPRRHVGGDIVRKGPLAGLVDRVPIQVRGEDLQGETPLALGLLYRLLEDDGQGISPPPGGAGGAPR